MDERRAEELLGDEELIPLLEGGLPQIRELQAALLAAEIPAVLGPGEQENVPGAPPRAQLCVREADLKATGELLRAQWAQLLEREGIVALDPSSAPPEVPEGGEPPCPACGTAAPLVNGACSDCGLQLE